STGFADVGALEIDRRRGDLWVVSTPAGGGGGVLHKLQLISGRNLAAFDVPAASGMVRLVDVAVSAGGTVLVLDAGGSRLLRLRPGAKTIEPLAALVGSAPRSMTVSEDERYAYVAVPEGLVRVEIASGSIQPVAAPAGLEV